MEETPKSQVTTVTLPQPALFPLMFSASLGLAASLGAQTLRLELPTDNSALFSDKPKEFYMFTYRNFEGESSRPWQAGQYGFVRNMKRTPEGIIGTRFHEGIDIRPVRRDSANRPLDSVRAIAPGTVAYVNPSAGRSNYGIYAVLEHDWGDGPFFSLYAHLAEAAVTTGQRLPAGYKLGKMGYTGSGLNRERAHLHLECSILLSLRFKEWHDQFFGSKNYHGIHNGMNLAGLDIAGLFLASRSDPGLAIPAFLKRTPTYYKVTTPRQGPLELAVRYPWLCRGDHARPSPSWEIAFSASGLPLAIAPSHRQVGKPLVTFVRTTRSRHEYFTKSYLTGSGRRASLTARGKRYLRLITGNFGSRQGS